MGIDQRRDVEAGVELAAVLALHAHLEAADDGLAAELIAQLQAQAVVLVAGPVAVGRQLADQIAFAPARHLAERGVHVGDAAFEVERAHAGQHRVFHRAAEVGFGDQGFLGAHAPARMAPGGQQQPGRHGAERADQPEQAVADKAQRSAVGLGAQHQAAAHGRYRHLIFVGPVAPPAPGVAAGALRQGRAGQQLAAAVEHGDRVASEHFGGRAVAQQAVDRVLAQHHAAKAARAVDGHLQLQQRHRLAGYRQRLRIDRLLQVLHLGKRARGVAGPQDLAGNAQLFAVHRGRRMAGAYALVLVYPADRLQLGVLGDQRFAAARKVAPTQLLVGDVARHAHQLLLAFEQAQAHALLGVFDIAAQCFLFALHFLHAQIPERDHDGRKKHQHRGQRRERGKTILSRGRQTAPPAAPPARGGNDGVGQDVRCGRRRRARRGCCRPGGGLDGSGIHGPSVEEQRAVFRRSCAGV